MTITLSIKLTIGIGDAIQFTSVPENYFLSTGKRVIDGTHHWVLDNNPFVIRNPSEEVLNSSKLVYGWNHNPRYIPEHRACYTSMAEQHTGNLNINLFTRHPKLYQFEDFPFRKREKILLHTHGRSHGTMPDHVIEHVLDKYGDMPLYHIRGPNDPDLGIPHLHTPGIWDLVKEISECRVLIGMDSGPSWIAACYPDVVVKKLRMKPTGEELKEWVPLDSSNIHSIWDDLQLQSVYNPSNYDVGFTSSYKRM